MNNNDKLFGFFIAIIVIVATVSGIYLISTLTDEKYSYSVKNFSSYEELLDFLSTNYEDYNNQYYRGFSNTLAPGSADSESTLDGDKSIDYSETNVQVEGVDEPDIVKTDGTYLYVLAAQNLYILRAYPVDNATILSKISFDEEVYISDLFVNDDYLIVFGSSYGGYPILYKDAPGSVEGSDESAESESEDEINESLVPESDEENNEMVTSYYTWDVPSSIIKIYDISVKEDPALVKDIEIDGTYFDSRMIGDYIYVVASEYSYYLYNLYDYDTSDYTNGNFTLNIPEIRIDNETKEIPYDQIYYFDSPEPVDTMTHILSIDLSNMDVNEKSYLIGVSENMYMSENNIYLVYTNYEYYTSSQTFLEYYSYEENTFIHKIQVNNGDIEYIGEGEVPGHVLNQFSMDEYNNFFRIATTVGYSWNENNPSNNNVYILDEDLEHVSELEGIAEGEQIYSSRFIGDKAYLVTFKNTDPFFTIDLSNPYNPEILGYLKIPGYSNYLHPYDENHIIGIGKDTIESDNPNFAWYQGIKIAIFDVSDFENPVELDKIIIGDRGTDSPALYDHKAFLFDKDKELLVIPISLYEISKETKDEYDDFPGPDYGEFSFQGAYVYNLNLDGFEYKGRVTHMSEDEKESNEYWWYWYESESYISRSLYIEDILYTISDKMVKMNNIDDLGEIKSLELE